MSDLNKTLDELNKLNFKLADLTAKKAELEEQVKTLLKHDVNAQRSYNVGKYKVTVTTGVNYTLDKKYYLECGKSLERDLNPVTESITYKVDPKRLNESLLMANEQELEIIHKMITEKPKKLNVKIGAAV